MYMHVMHLTTNHGQSTSLVLLTVQLVFVTEPAKMNQVEQILEK